MWTNDRDYHAKRYNELANKICKLIAKREEEIEGAGQ